MVGRRALHRRRLHVLVRGHLSQQGHRPHAVLRDVQINGKPGKMRRSTTSPSRSNSPKPYCLFVYQLAGSTAIGAGLATRERLPELRRRLCAGPLPQAVPAQVLRPTKRRTRRPRTPASTAGCRCSRSKDSWALNPELPVMTPWRTVTPDQHADLVAGAQSLLLGGRHRRQPASLHRQDHDDAGREPRGRQPARHRRRVRHPGAPHATSPSCRSSSRTSRRATTRVHLDPAVNGSDMAMHIGQLRYDADPEIAKWIRNKDFRRALSLGIDRDQLNETFWLGVGTPGSRSPGARLRSTTRARSGARSGLRWTSKQANDLLDKIGLTKKDAEGYPPAHRRQGRLRLEMVTDRRPVRALHAGRRDGHAAVEEDRHRRSTSRSSSATWPSPATPTTSTR